MIRVWLPSHLRTLARLDKAVVEIEPERATMGSVLDTLERDWPVLAGAIRDRQTGKRRAFVRYYAGAEDLSHEAPDAPLPDAVARGAEELRIIGAIAGG
jgi:hypothetical protein